MATKTEWAWIAGLYEGEGTAYGRKGRSVMVAILMTDEAPVRRVYDLIGGSFDGPIALAGKRKEGYRWRIQSRDNVIPFYENIREWLSPRRRAQLEEAIRLTTKEQRPTSPPCGQDPNVPSSAGRVRHARAGEPPCDDCRAANALYNKQLRRSKDLPVRDRIRIRV